MSAFRIAKYATILLLACSTVGAGERNQYAKQYLSDPDTPDEIKVAIKKGVVVVGMCPYQAFAAAGDPGPYHVKRDPTRWPEHSDPVKIIQSQCKSPDKSVIELMFKNTSQFGSKEPLVFRVRFIDGRVVLIDQKGFKED
jgi:hypothetical protein